MKRSVVISICCLVAVAFVSFKNSYYHSPLYSSGAPAGFCGDPGGGKAYCTSCHSGAPVYSVSEWITSNIPTAGYVPGKTYSITAFATRFGHSKFGFEISPQNISGKPLGTIVITDPLTQLTGSLFEYITHTYTGTIGMDSVGWKFDWVAPPAESGTVTFYGAFNMTNDNFSSSGDTIATSTLTIPEDITTNISAAALKGPNVLVFPNLVTDIININFSIKSTSVVEISLIDVQGKILETLAPELYSAGGHSRSFKIRGKCANGIYFIKVSIGEYVVFEKILVQSYAHN